MNSPKRIADYFYIVGLRDDTSLYPSDNNNNRLQEHTDQHHHNQDKPATATVLHQTVSNAGSPKQQLQQQQHQQHQLQQQQHQQQHQQGPLQPKSVRPVSPKPTHDRRLSYAAIAAANIAGPPAATTTMTTADSISSRLPPSPLANSSAFKSPNRGRSQSMAQFHPPVVPAGFDKQETEGSPLRGPPATRPMPVRQSRRLSTASMVGPPRRPMTLTNGNNPGNVVLQHKSNYRYVSAGTLYKAVQGGLDNEKTVDDIQDEHDTTSPNRQTRNELTEPAVRSNTVPSSDKQTLSVQEIKSAALGRSNSVARRTKLPSGDKTPGIEEKKEIKPDVHPAERVFTPIVTCRYPETDWKDAEPFPTFLPMFCFPAELSFKMSDERPQTTYHSFVLTQETGGRSYAMCVTIYERLPQKMYEQFDTLCQRWTRSHMSESEIEYAKAIKSKIFLEKKLLKSLQLQLREEKTLGRRARQAQLQREILDSEEKLSLLDGQMKPWRGLFVEAEDAWIPRCIGLVSAVPYHYLLRDWLLGVVVACSGGVEHPGMSMSSFRLESYVKNLIHEVNLPPFGKVEIGITINNRMIYASRPALNNVPIVKNFSLFPLFRCLSAEDIVTIMEVILSEGKLIFVSSYPGMLTLASEGFLFLLFPFYWQGVYIPILPSALMTCLQAPVPYIIGIERRSRDAEFPPEEACVVDLDKGVIQVQLAPTPLPSRQRRKLIQCFEQYAPKSAIRRSADNPNPALGPPAYIKEAFPHSRFTMFCGISRAPRPTKAARPLSSIPYGGSSISQHSITMDPRGNGSTNTLPSLSSSELSKGDQVQQPLSYSKVAGGMARSASEGILDKGQDSLPKDGGLHRDALSRAESMKESSPSLQHSSESLRSTSSRKVFSPRSRSSMFEPRRQENASYEGAQPGHPMYNRQNSSNSTHMSIVGGFDSPGLRHRGSFTSIESSSSSVMSKSPVSATTSSTMASINGHSSPTASGALSSEDEAGTSSGAEKTPPTVIEGHILSPVSSPIPISLLNCRCGICSQFFISHNIVHRCESCSLYVHAGCLDELLHPCVPRGFDEPGVCWSVLQMWAGLMKGYRNGITAGPGTQHYNPHSPLQPQHHQFQNYPARMQGHIKQLSNSGSEGEREGRDKLSWASFQRWTGRNGHGGVKNMMSPSSRASSDMERMHQSHPQRSQSSTQPRSRARSGTDCSNRSNRSNHSTHSEIVSFHRDLFLKGVDKEARPFMSVFTESQAFVQFIQDRIDRSSGDPEIMFFDEVIKAKNNRSKFRLGKEETKFLDDPSYGIQGTMRAIPPSGDIQLYDEDERRFPTTLDPAYL